MRRLALAIMRPEMVGEFGARGGAALVRGLDVVPGAETALEVSARKSLSARKSSLWIIGLVGFTDPFSMVKTAMSPSFS